MLLAQRPASAATSFRSTKKAISGNMNPTTKTKSFGAPAMDQIARSNQDEPAFAPALRALVLNFETGDLDDHCESILLDTDLDGCRYLLVRMPAVSRKAAPLSPREIEIVRLVAAGHPNKVIAVVLEISAWTVCTHLRRIFAKLGVNSRAAMIAKMTEFGLVPRAAEPADLQRVLRKFGEKQDAVF